MINRPRKITWVSRQEIMETKERICDGKIVFLIKLALSIIVPDALLKISANSVQIDIPAVSQITKGTSLTGWTLKPTLKTNQNTPMSTIGWRKVQTNPNRDPTCWVATCRLAMEMIKFFWVRISRRKLTKLCIISKYYAYR